jgi:hypothetical protein
MNHPQVLIDPDSELYCDEKIAPLVHLARQMGLETTGSCQGYPFDAVESVDGSELTKEIFAPAYITFATIPDGLEFLSQTASLTNYIVGDLVGLFVIRPLVGTSPTSKVVWNPIHTDLLLNAWLKK